MTAICKTCGGTPDHHKPSMFDKNGIGHPDHSVATAADQPECICGLDKADQGKPAVRFAIVCPKHDGPFTAPNTQC